MVGLLRSPRTAPALLIAALLCVAAAPPASARTATANAPAAFGNQLDRLLSDYETITLDPAAFARQVKGSGRVTIETPTRSFDVYLGIRDMRPARVLRTFVEIQADHF